MALQRQAERLEEELGESKAREAEANAAVAAAAAEAAAAAAAGGEKRATVAVVEALEAELRAVRAREVAATVARHEDASGMMLPAPTEDGGPGVEAAAARCAALEAELGELQAANNRLAVDKAEAERATSLRWVGVRWEVGKATLGLLMFVMTDRRRRRPHLSHGKPGDFVSSCRPNRLSRVTMLS